MAQHTAAPQSHYSTAACRQWAVYLIKGSFAAHWCALFYGPVPDRPLVHRQCKPKNVFRFRFKRITL
jgi:hypothetical protein